MKRVWYLTDLIDMLPYLTKLLEANEIKYWLDWGTLLGAVRNGRIIPWDFDIDLGIFSDDIAKALQLRVDVWKDGYDIEPCSVLPSKLLFYKKDNHGDAFHIDLDSWTIDGDIARSTFNPDIIHTMEELSVLVDIEFEGQLYPAPREPEKVLERLFGEDWRTPKVSVGNWIYIQRYDPDNIEIRKEASKYNSYISAWDEAFAK
jgi:hypothetical protein